MSGICGESMTADVRPKAASAEIRKLIQMTPGALVELVKK
jgi:hypothetical protein